MYFITVLATKPVLKDLHNIVTPDYAIHWRIFGTHLGIKSGVLDAIYHDYQHKADDCCNAVWEEWLNIDVNAAWSKLITIVNLYLTHGDQTTPIIDDDMCNIILNSSNQLQQHYQDQRYNNMEDEWPPIQPDHFTSVAIIHHKEKHATVREVIAVATKAYKGNLKVDVTNQENTQETEQSIGTTKRELPDEYFTGCKSAKDIVEIFAPLQKSNMPTKDSVTPRFILIEGAPGIGKTILSKEIALQWANKNLLSKKSLLFLIFLRDPFIETIKCLKDFVSYVMGLNQQNKKVEAITEHLDNTSGKHIAIVFDGYDEISEELRDKSFIGSIINRKILILCSLVITSRPTASSALHSKCDCRVEILGFTKENRTKYIHQSLGNDQAKIKELENYLEMNPFIDSLCYIPLNMTILICLFKEVSNPILPKNQTDMNDQFVCITISRFLRKNNIKADIKSLENLPAPYKQQFKNLSRLAFDLLGKDKVVFNDNDVKQYSNWSDLGLLKVVKYSSFLKCTPVASYNFLHFSLQEFLAAYYVTSLALRSQVHLLKDKFWNNRYLNSWVMYAGLTKGSSLAFKHFLAGRKFVLHSLLVKPKDITIEIISNKVKCLHLFQCFLEAGDDKICQQVGSSLFDETIDLSNTTLLLIDMHTLSFFLTRSTTKEWKLLDISNCCIGDDGCDTLANLLLGDDKYKVQIKKLNLSSNQLSLKSIPTILKFIHHFNIKELLVTGNCFDGEMVLESFFTNFIQQHLFHELFLSIETNKNKVSVYAVNYKELLASQVQKYFDTDCNICSIFLWNTNFKVDELLMLNDTSKQHNVELNIYKEDSDAQIVRIQSEIQIAIDRATKEDKSSQNVHLNFSYILISQTQMLAYNVNHSQIVQVMEHSCKPSTLALNFTACSLDKDSLQSIGNVLSGKFLSVKFKKLVAIDMSGCSIGDIRCEGFFKELFSINSVIKYLKELNLSSNKLTDSCINTIIEFLQYCVIEKLNISHNKIKENTFCYAFKNYYRKLTLLNSISKVPLTVISSNGYVETYITKFIGADASDVFDALLTSADNHFHRVLFFNCSSMPLNNFDKISLLLKNKIKVEIQDSTILDSVAAELVAKFDAENGKNLHYILIGETNLYVRNYNYEEIKLLLPCDNSKVIFQLKDCDIPGVAIPQTLKNIAFLKSIQLIDLSKCKIGDSGCKTFCNFFENVTSNNTAAYLHKLNLSDNCLTSQCTVYIIRFLQFCTVKNLILSCNDIDSENFNISYFKNKCNTYHNFSSKVPLIVVNDKETENQVEVQQLKLLHFTVFFLSIIPTEDLTDMLSMTECHTWVFLINTNIQKDCFNKITEILLANKLMKITIIEEEFEDNVSNDIMTGLKMLQVIRSNESRDSESIQYLLLSNKKCLANNVNHSTKFLNFSALPDFVNYCLSFHACGCRQWEVIDFTNCSIGDHGCTILLDYFTQPECTVELLNLSNNNLSSHCVNTIAQLVIRSKLKTLFISLNDVKENYIADDVCRLQSESSNKINIPAVVRIFKNNCVGLIVHNLIISSVHKLINCKSCDVTFLSLENCYLNNEHTNTTLLSLNELNLSQRVLGELVILNQYNDVEVLEDDKKITHFIIKNSNITHKSIILLTSKVLQDSLCIHLDLSHCKLQENDFFNIFGSLEGTSSLKVLNLKSNFITDSVADKIFCLISKNLQLEIVNLSECSLKEYGIKSILKAVARLSSLKSINLSFLKYHYHINDYRKSINQQTLTSSFDLLFSIISSNQSLEYLNISNCKITNDDFANIMKSTSLLESIKHLDISGNTVTDIVADNVALAIRRNKDLEYLNVSNCFMNEQGLFAIFNVDNFKLQHLDVSFCKLTEQDIKVLTNCLKGLPNLKHFNVSHNYMNQSSAKNMVTAFSHNKSLEYLDLSKCGFVDFNILDTLLHQNSLKTLLLRSNSVFQDGTLLHAQSISSHLEYLDLSKCDLFELQMIKIARQLLQVSTLKCLDISHNILSDTVTIEIASVITCNPFLERINLSSCELSGSQIIEVARALKSLSRLKYFDISYNNITNEAAIKLASALTANRPLEYLNLSNCGLSELHTSTVFTNTFNKTISCLNVLDVSCNKLIESSVDEIVSVIISNPLLQHLNLANCELSELQIISLCKSLQRTSLLTFLDISHNEVTGEAANELATVLMNNKLLQHLNFSACNFQEDTLMLVADSLAYTTSLVSFDMSYNIITEKSAEKIGTVLNKNTDLEKLNFCGCFPDNSNTAMVVLSAISQHNSLTHLSVKSTVITNDLAKLIASILIRSNNIRHLDLGQCNLHESGFLRILNSLINTNALKCLNFEENTITEGLVSKLTSVIRKNCTLKHLNLCSCNLPQAQIQSITHSISEVCSIENLNISGNETINWASGYLKQALSRNNKMRHLDFSRCKICGERLLDILMPLTTIKCLKSLNFRSCYFDEPSAPVFLSDVITRNMALQYLNLTDCNLEEKGLVIIAKALQANIALKYLSLSSNYITTEASQELALAVSKKCKLQCLALSDCQLEETSLIVIAEALCKISSLRHLDLSHNNITDRAASTIASAIACNTKLEHLDFSHCAWQETGVAVVHEVINKLALIKEADFQL